MCCHKVQIFEISLLKIIESNNLLKKYVCGTCKQRDAVQILIVMQSVSFRPAANGLFVTQVLYE